MSRRQRLLARLYRRRHDLPLAVEAAIWLLLARVLLVVLPFRRVAALLAPAPGRGGRAPDRPRQIARTRWAVTVLAKRVPWRAVCLQQAIAAQRLLWRRGVESDLYLGAARKPDGALAAHAWVLAGDDPVVGVETAAGFSCVAVFRAGRGIERPDRS